MLRIHPRIHAKIAYETKCQLFISKRKGTDLNDCKDSKAFIEQSNDMDDINKNNEENNPENERKVLIIFYDMVKDMLSNTKFNPVVTELFIRGRKLNLFLTKSSDIDYE